MQNFKFTCLFWSIIFRSINWSINNRHTFNAFHAMIEIEVTGKEQSNKYFSIFVALSCRNDHIILCAIRTTDSHKSTTRQW